MQQAIPRRTRASQYALLSLLRQNRSAVIGWLSIAALLSSLLWLWAMTTTAQEKKEIETEARRSAITQAKVYADQLDRSLAQIDYIMLNLKYHWEETGGAVNLEKQMRAGLVPVSSELLLTVSDRLGKPVTSTFPLDETSPSIAGRSYFQQHAQDASHGLLISGPVMGLRTKRMKIMLSRRLETAQGDFDGMIVVATEPGYFVSFPIDSTIHEQDFVAVCGADGTFFAAKTAADANARDALYKTHTGFSTSNGVMLEPGAKFVDGKARIVAWHSARTYSVVALVGVSLDSRYLAYLDRERELRSIATLGSFIFLLLGISGIGYSFWRIEKKRSFNEVIAAYRLATENAQDAFYMMRPIEGPDGDAMDFLVEDCNEQGAMNVGADKDALIGRRLSELVPATYLGSLMQSGRLALAQGFYEEEAFVPAHGTRKARWSHRKLVRSGRALAVTVRDITAAKDHEDTLHRLANADALTSLPNRHWLTGYLPAAIEKAVVNNKSLALLFVDLDDFKNLNDTMGHAAGDELLKAAALRLKAVLRPQDSVARLGGDEFTMILESIEGDVDVIAIADRIIDTLREPFVVADGHRHIVHASIGISVFPQDGTEGETLLKNADIAMYAAKAAGKGTYCFFHQHLSENLVQKITRQAQLKQAIERHELALYYQPRVDGMTGELRSLEALVRWIHPVRGIVPPDEFIPMAEETGLIIPLGEQVIRMAGEQVAQWQKEGLPMVPISVNVSARQINSGSVSQVIVAALAHFKVDARLIEVEITESATVGESKIAAGELVTLQGMGIRLYVDDFGTGYSSLSQLRRLDMDGLKVDRAFTGQLTRSAEDLELFRAIVSMAHAIHMHVVAEGVETAEQLKILQGLSCDEVQGYYISRPIPAADTVALLKKRFLFPGVQEGAC